MNATAMPITVPGVLESATGMFTWPDAEAIVPNLHQMAPLCGRK
jgi:hypothetical protein